MRFLMRVSFPPEKFNDAVRAGTAGALLGKILGEIKPEAAYFTAHEGRRTGYLVINMTDTSQMPALAEPFFLSFNATVDLSPVMLPADLQKSGLEEIGKKWK